MNPSNALEKVSHSQIFLKKFLLVSQFNEVCTITKSLPCPLKILGWYSSSESELNWLSAPKLPKFDIFLSVLDEFREAPEINFFCF